MEVNINSQNFESEVLNFKGTVIVDFYGTWCMPCKMLAPIVEKVVADNNFKLAKVDVDENELEVVGYVKERHGHWEYHGYSINENENCKVGTSL